MSQSSHSNSLGPFRLLAVLIALLLPLSAFAQAGRIYTKPDPSSQGAITGHLSAELTHAIALEHDRTRAFLGDLSDSGHGFHFAHLPIGKYDLVLVTKTGAIYEGLTMGSSPSLPEDSLKNAEKRITRADGFFNQVHIHRTGIREDGTTFLAFVERYRANSVLKQSGEALGQMVRRLEIVELTQAGNDWQLTGSRHLYREGEPSESAHFFHSINLSNLSNIRVVGEPKDLGEIALPTSTD